MKHFTVRAATGLVAAAAVTLAPCVNATAINGDPNNGLASPIATITFDPPGPNVPANNAPLTTQYASQGIALLSGFFYNGCPTLANGCPTTSPSGTKPDIGNFFGEDFDGTVNPPTSAQDIKFTLGHSGIAFQLVANNPTGALLDFTAFLLGLPVVGGHFTGNGAVAGYYGFANDVFLDEIRIQSPAAMPVAMLIDNLQLGGLTPTGPGPGPTPGVPIPAPLALIGLGLVVMTVGGRLAR